MKPMHVATWHSSTGADLKITRRVENGKVLYACTCRREIDIHNSKVCPHLFSLFRGCFKPEKVEFTRVGAQILKRCIAANEERLS
jgi:hypothetical protein